MFPQALRYNSEGHRSGRQPFAVMTRLGPERQGFLVSFKAHGKLVAKPRPAAPNSMAREGWSLDPASQ
ncbi:hypothetical protein ACYOEI_13795 [Singulisphaera rosea]